MRRLSHNSIVLLTMAACVLASCGGGGGGGSSGGPVTVTDPEGGLFTWLTFPEGFDATAFMRDVALPQARVAYVPGETFFPLTPRPNHARFNYSAQSPEKIQAGIAALGRALQSHFL